MSKPQSHSTIIQIIHWLSAPLIIGLFILGIWMVELSYYHTWYQRAPDIHKSLGILLFIILFVRIIARCVQTQPEPVSNIPKWQHKAAEFTHILMYVCIFIILVSGYLMSTASGKPVLVFDWFSVPALISYGDIQADNAGLVHQYTAYLLICTVILHILAFVQHQFFYKDHIIKRITPLK
ncbi:cytochrome b [Catenovulum adriaticum]|uniref:Cytochrome b n=1 Tax=Catenovulum adriaticum TaxID=2984846 RepID=A0ABY7ALX9_9ALTE|nr:cytochrome b [Catenovulum sp. TS8]WAJ70565.1 cytochrome b [Catenovulum sp. TS8]